MPTAPNFSQHIQWPERLGFSLWGKGPTFVIAVAKESVADEAALKPGDQLLELDGVDVSKTSLEEILEIVNRRPAGGVAPALGVISRLQRLELVPHHSSEYGFQATGSKPIIATKVVPDGPAFQCGLREGDLILKVNDCNVTHSIEIERFISTGHSLALDILALPSRRRGEPTVNFPLVDGGHPSTLPKSNQTGDVQKAQMVGQKINQMFSKYPYKKAALLSYLKSFSQTHDTKTFVENLNEILTNQQERRLLTDMRNLIPKHLVPMYDRSLATLPNNINQSEMIPSPHSHRPLNQPITSAAPPAVRFRSRSISRGSLPELRETHSYSFRKEDVDEHGYGFDLSDKSPITLTHVSPGSLSAKAGMKAGDSISRINGLDVSQSSTHHVTDLLKLGLASGKITLEIQRSLPIQHNSPVPRHARAVSVPQTSDDVELFKTKVNDLLNPEEKTQLKIILENYRNTHDPMKFANGVNALLSSPRKSELWTFLLHKLPPDHRDYCQKFTNEMSGQTVTHNAHSHNQDFHQFPKSMKSTNTLPKRLDHMGSFKQQLEYLLTSRERSGLKKLLQYYSADRDINRFIAEVELLLDTPSKRNLWLYIIPLLSNIHQDYCRARLNLPRSVGASSGSLGNVLNSGETDEKEIDLGEDDFNIIGEAATILRNGEEPESSQLKDRRKSEPMNELILDEEGDVFESNRQNYRMPNRNSYTSFNEADKHLIFPKGTNLLRNKTPPSIFIEHDLSPTNSIDENRNSSPTPSNVIYRLDGEPVDPEQVPPGSSLLLIENEKSPLQAATDVNEGKFTPRMKNKNAGHDRNHEVRENKEFGDEENMSADEIIDIDSSLDRPPVNGDILNGVIPPPPLPMDIPEHPPIPAPPPMMPMINNTGVQMNVKRLNWDKLEVRDMEGTIWAHISTDKAINEIVNFLELDEQFAMTAPVKKVSANPETKTSKLHILDQKKAYNISILLAHMKIPPSDLRNALYEMNDHVYTQEILEHFIKYLPDDDEKALYDEYTGSYESFSSADKFGYTMTRIPGCKQRLMAMLFKSGFSERVNTLKKHLTTIHDACHEILCSKKLSRILELILAMGNFLNRGNVRIGEASAIKISSLRKLELTKTADGKTTFLHVLAEAVYNRYPEAIPLREDLPSVQEAAKASSVPLNEEVDALKVMIKTIESTIDELNKVTSDDRGSDLFKQSMNEFTSGASSIMDEILQFQVANEQKVQSMLRYFGEDPGQTNTEEIFSAFAHFLLSFEKAHHYNMTHKRHSE